MRVVSHPPDVASFHGDTVTTIEAYGFDSILYEENTLDINIFSVTKPLITCSDTGNNLTIVRNDVRVRSIEFHLSS